MVSPSASLAPQLFGTFVDVPRFGRCISCRFLGPLAACSHCRSVCGWGSHLATAQRPRELALVRFLTLPMKVLGLLERTTSLGNVTVLMVIGPVWLFRSVLSAQLLPARQHFLRNAQIVHALFHSLEMCDLCHVFCEQYKLFFMLKLLLPGRQRTVLCSVRLKMCAETQYVLCYQRTCSTSTSTSASAVITCPVLLLPCASRLRPCTRKSRNSHLTQKQIKVYILLVLHSIVRRTPGATRTAKKNKKRKTH